MNMSWHFSLLGFFVFVDYDSPYFLVYAERNTSAIVEGISIKTEADLMLAKEKGEVLKPPYCCSH